MIPARMDPIPVPGQEDATEGAGEALMRARRKVRPQAVRTHRARRARYGRVDPMGDGRAWRSVTPEPYGFIAGAVTRSRRSSPPTAIAFSGYTVEEGFDARATDNRAAHCVRLKCEADARTLSIVLSKSSTRFADDF